VPVEIHFEVVEELVCIPTKPNPCDISLSSLDELFAEAIVFEALEYPLSFQTICVVLELLNKAPVHFLCKENGLKEAKDYL
jgi:hypothetical protein